MKNNSFRPLSFFLVFLWISACTTAPNPIAISPTATNTVITQTALPTETETPQLSTQTSVPTLTSEEANDLIRRLLSGEKSCPFPCWWGFTPGQTQIVEVRNFLESLGFFSVGTPRLDSDKGYARFIVPQHQDSYLHLTFTYKGQEEVLELLWLRIQTMIKVTDADGRSNYEVAWNDPFLTEITKPYSLSQVLSKYGMPSEVWIRTYQAALLNQPWPISLVVYYPEQGFMIEYVADGKGAPNSSIGWCPFSAFPNFWFWSPSNEITLDNIVSKIPGEELDRESLRYFKTIEEATGMNIEEFYSLFEGNEDKCVETPVNIWPMPGQ